MSDFVVRNVPPSLNFLTLHFRPYTQLGEGVYLQYLLARAIVWKNESNEEVESKRKAMQNLILQSQEFVREANMARVKVSIRGINYQNIFLK